MSRRAHFFMMLNLVATAAMATWLHHGSAVEALGATDRGQSRYRVRLGLVDLVPKCGFDAGEAARGEPFLIQLYEVPDWAVRSGLEEAGIELLGYVGGRSYLARCDGGCGADGGALDRRPPS